MVEASLVSYVELGVLVIGVVIALLQLRDIKQTRQAELFMHLYQGYASKEVQKTWIDLLHMDWKNYADFERKYGSGDNPDNYAIRESHWAWYDGMGVLLKKNLVDAEMVYETLGHGGAIFMWNKFGSVIKEQREIFNIPNRMMGFEYLADKMKAMREARGAPVLQIEVPETFDRYLPDK